MRSRLRFAIATSATAALGLLVATSACMSDEPSTGDKVPAPAPLTQWTQVGGDSSHRGVIDAVAKRPARILADVVYDPFVGQETDPLTTDGDLLIHYQAPLVMGDDVYTEVKSGAYTPCQSSPASCSAADYDSQVWNESYFKWVNGQLVHQWDYASDWKPIVGVGFEQMFHAAAFGDFLYVPGAGGALHKVDRHSGALVKRLVPPSVGAKAHVAGPPAIDGAGNVFYNVVQLDLTNPTADAESWLVRVSASDQVSSARYQDLVPGAPQPGALCYTAFSSNAPKPLPPPPNADGSPAQPPQATCFSQRPGINSSPAIGADGTVYVVSRAHRNDRYSYLVAVNPDLTPKWARSLRDLFDDGCGVTVEGCRSGATKGVDPNTNQRPAARVNDSSTASPVVLPDGHVLYGSYSGYNGSRGHLIKFNGKSGEVMGFYGFGWDITPAVWWHDDTYSILLKDNHYANLPADEEFFITQLSRDLQVEWQHKANNPKVCERGADGQVTCQTVEGDGQEWCINAPAVDKNGTVHVASEDGNLYQIAQGGQEKARAFLQRSLRSGYTPTVLDAQGRIYSMNAGHLFVYGE
ncbi:hypothetical protein FGE12_08455 [Aggregicoccus sp. 17bor-14]|uniref:hypothetical protein n=1 Tax=Myxococcaceae TaxID=31 RepID=UPI00129C9D55|nr:MULTISPECIES: hypothetical protein [Myxococcaceae]MBF5042429.1 hypothetical protein [Simulacricoccus sp. 17bor-14]MRI88200.1 hypothetical protein [Aggregicoccus sp. 17bor-14]